MPQSTMERYAQMFAERGAPPVAGQQTVLRHDIVGPQTSKIPSPP